MIVIMKLSFRTGDKNFTSKKYFYFIYKKNKHVHNVKEFFTISEGKKKHAFCKSEHCHNIQLLCRYGFRLQTKITLKKRFYSIKMSMVTVYVIIFYYCNEAFTFEFYFLFIKR